MFEVDSSSQRHVQILPPSADCLKLHYTASCVKAVFDDDLLMPSLVFHDTAKLAKLALCVADVDQKHFSSSQMITRLASSSHLFQLAPAPGPRGSLHENPAATQVARRHPGLHPLHSPREGSEKQKKNRHQGTPASVRGRSPANPGRWASPAPSLRRWGCSKSVMKRIEGLVPITSIY